VRDPWLLLRRRHGHHPRAQLSGTDLGASAVTDEKFTAVFFRELEKLAPFWDPTDPNLGAFEHAGGKLILWQGEA
jgi:hypothetical protein